MGRIAFFSDLMSTLFERRPSGAGVPSRIAVADLCESLLSSKGEVSGSRIAQDILAHYKAMNPFERQEFFQGLATALDIDPDMVIKTAEIYRTEPTAFTLAALFKQAEPRRQELFRRLNQSPGGTAELVRMRLDLLELLPEAPELEVIDVDFQHLFASWFNRGFLVLRPIDWRTPANILERIIQYEAVHAINDWKDLQRRLLPADRRCFAFFHPAMPEDPLIFVEVALCKGVPGSVQDLLAEDRIPVSETEFDTAVFYSISNCQKGLRGVSFGNSLIKQVVEELKRDIPSIARFVTLSPVPGLGRWLKEEASGNSVAEEVIEATDVGSVEKLGLALRGLTAEFLLTVKRSDDLPADPVARFHLGNGALLHDIHVLADTSTKGFQQSATVMVNYLYDPELVEQNHESFINNRNIAASKQVLALLSSERTTGRKS